MHSVFTSYAPSMHLSIQATRASPQNWSPDGTRTDVERGTASVGVFTRAGAGHSRDLHSGYCITGSPSLSVKAILVVAVHASTAAPQAGARRLRWFGSNRFTESEGDPHNVQYRKSRLLGSITDHLDEKRAHGDLWWDVSGAVLSRCSHVALTWLSRCCCSTGKRQGPTVCWRQTASISRLRCSCGS